MKTIKIGIIGAGRIGRVHAENIAKFVPEMEIKTIADPYMSEETVEFLRRLRIPNIVKDADVILNDPEIKAAVDEAVTEFVSWQCGKLGRDINPSVLIGKLMQTGIKRVALTSPVFTTLRDGSDDTTPQVAAVGTITSTNGGYEDE